MMDYRRTGYLLKLDDEVSVVVETPEDVVKNFSVKLGDDRQRAVAKRDIPALRRKPNGLYRVAFEPYENIFSRGWTITEYIGINETEELKILEKDKKKELSKAFMEMVGLEEVEEVEEKS